MNPDQPSQPFKPTDSDEGSTAPESTPLPSSAPDWQQQAVSGAAASAGESQSAGTPAAPVAPSPLGEQAPVSPVASSEPSPQPVVSGGMPGQPMGAQPSPVTGGAAMPSMSASQMQSGNGGGMLKRIIIVVVGLIVLAGLGYGGYVIIKSAQRAQDKNATNSAVKKSESSTSAPDINTLSSFTLTEPPASAMTGFVGTPSNSQSAPTTLANADQSCVVLYGVLNQTALPGTDIGDIVSKATQTIRSQGISITGPNTEQALVLKATDGKSYSLPTVGFSYSKSGTTEVAIYSISQLKDGTHAAVLQVCYGQDTVANLTNKLNTVTKPVVEAIGIQTQ